MVESADNNIRPALVLDIDGVFIVPGETKTEGYTEHPRFPTHAYNPSHGEWLNNITDSLADAYYISDCMNLSHWTIGQHLEVPEFDWINADVYPARRKAASRALAITALFGNRPLAWIDDIIGTPERRWSQRRNETGTPTLLVKTDKNVGLRPGHLNRVTKWLERLTDQ